MKGDTSGESAIRILHTGGMGAQTLNGIKLIEVEGASNANFVLANGDYTMRNGKQAIIFGAYSYSLYNNGALTGNDGNWYLRSQYQPAVPVLEAYGQTLLDLNAVSSYRERAGNRYFVTPYALNQLSGKNPQSQTLFWGRVEGSHAQFTPQYSTSGTSHMTNRVTFETGLDLLLNENRYGSVLGGILVNYTHGASKIDTYRGNKGRVGTINSYSYGIGANLTWINENGFYVDSLAKINWYHTDLETLLLGALRSDNDGFGYALSLEAGHRFILQNGWNLTPQAQLSWSAIDFDDFTDAYQLSVSLHKAQSLTARIGLGFEHEAIVKMHDGSNHKSNFYAIANLYQDFADGIKVKLNDKMFENRNQRLWGGLTVGANYSWHDDKYALFGEASVKTSLQNFSDSYAIKGNIGMKVKW